MGSRKQVRVAADARRYALIACLATALSGPLVLSMGCSTTYDFITKVTPQDGIRYVLREENFLFFVVSSEILRCTETTGSETYCVRIAFLDGTKTPLPSMPCSPTVCGMVVYEKGEHAPAEVAPPPSGDEGVEPDHTPDHTAPKHAILLNRKPLFELPAPSTTKVRTLVGESVVLRTVYGKDVRGKLLEVSPTDGLVLLRQSQTVKYPWLDVSAIWIDKE